MRLTVRLFAMLREQAGADSVELELSEGAPGADALEPLRAEPGLELLDRLPVRLAVNREYADLEDELAAGDELAVIPPGSGGSGRQPARISAEPLDAAEISRIVGRPGAGAIVTFQGTTREVER